MPRKFKSNAQRKAVMAKLTRGKRVGGWVFNRWSKKTGRPLKSMMVNATKGKAIKYVRKSHTIRTK